MPYNPKIHNRKSIRLKGYDYSQAGLYFITICCQDRACLFGEIYENKMILNDAGKMIENEWFNLKNRYQNIELHEYVTMPNHFHGIIQIVGETLVVAPNENENKNDKGQPQGIAPTDQSVKNIKPQGNDPVLGDILGAFKSITTVKYIHGVNNFNLQPFKGKLWQRNYYEHIIRNDKAYLNISAYINNNPKNWEKDTLK